ncbi:hypothetical protein [Nocardia sp. alder85J]|uniref:hypothetical protein n=1 Tax=Nocardia sp. alder85J TaxID=2862949 RepID=UPI001CD6D8A8|nr:hypothetical protein [Nocardia sp. alder85J]MCX4099225.1 hypothetical protein [Nocardia sp. alder85J]
MTESSTGIPEIEHLVIHTAIVGTTPVVILLPRVRSVHIAPTGALVTSDAWTDEFRARGAVPLRDMAFAGARTPGWRITVDAGLSAIRIAGPAGLGVVGAGELVSDPSWRRAVERDLRDRGGLVVVTGTAQSTEPEAAVEMMEQDRAVWIRAAVTVR